MNPILQLRLQRFVDREAEMRSFRAMLDERKPERPVTAVWADGQMGKSTLLDCMDQECERRGLARARVLWNETRNQDFLGVMGKLADDLGAKWFEQFKALVQFFSLPPEATLKLVGGGGDQIRVAENLQNQGTIGVIAGVNVAVNNLNVSLLCPEHGIGGTERMARLTDAFLRDLRAAAAKTPAVLFLDAFEKASEITRAWVCDELVCAALDGRLERVRIVISGRIRPTLPEEWWSAANEMHLTPLQREHVIQYIGRTGVKVSAAAQGEMITAFLALSEGVPGRLESVVRTYASFLERQAA